MWNKHIQPLWAMYDPAKLTIKWRKPYGSKSHPQTVYNCQVLFEQTVVYDGFDQQIYDLSVPKAPPSAS